MSYDTMEVLEILDTYETALKKSVDGYKAHILNIRAGRANPHILDKVMVDYYGTPTPLNQVANITIPEARMIMITVWDTSIMKTVEKAIIDANIGITPNNDGQNIRLIFPEPTEERRRSLVKDVKTLAEKCKVAIRNIRRDAIAEVKSLEKNKVISEDFEKQYEEEVDKKINARIAEIDKTAQAKEAEILKI